MAGSSGGSTGGDESPSHSTQDYQDHKPLPKLRGSRGQALPTIITQLPPRKQAKTEDEKEQRRIERILRNRRAAQSFRDRKKLEFEAIEKRNMELEKQLRDSQSSKRKLAQELSRLRKQMNQSTDSVRSKTTYQRPTILVSHSSQADTNSAASDMSDEATAPAPAPALAQRRNRDPDAQSQSSRVSWMFPTETSRDSEDLISQTYEATAEQYPSPPKELSHCVNKENWPASQAMYEPDPVPHYNDSGFFLSSTYEQRDMLCPWSENCQNFPDAGHCCDDIFCPDQPLAAECMGAAGPDFGGLEFMLNDKRGNFHADKVGNKLDLVMGIPSPAVSSGLQYPQLAPAQQQQPVFNDEWAFLNVHSFR
ncbi:uncharacterized protein UV8b_03268 [Ustilaginoidea virens]|uniref:BZIP domain-containing protein n=1 Tax=Ustilaginoidea virens TaxID=1159556 RepID=A0A8E5MGY4_USTVR|nr:uncharacterized protein UV8b_03268 [Ustilaginoidea virens]QUC19027.1 hypothetical protein UV8b_03268 [Ustilaginoidea virens]